MTHSQDRTAIFHLVSILGSDSIFSCTVYIPCGSQLNFLRCRTLWNPYAWNQCFLDQNCHIFVASVETCEKHVLFKLWPFFKTSTKKILKKLEKLSKTHTKIKDRSNLRQNLKISEFVYYEKVLFLFVNLAKISI